MARESTTDFEADVNLERGVYRRIYAGACKGRRINSVSMLAELLFWRLNLVADDFGAFEADPFLIKCQALTLRKEVSEREISDALKELEDADLLTTYTVKSERYGLIRDFEDRQPANRNGRRFRRFPAPNNDSGESGRASGNPGESKKSKPSVSVSVSVSDSVSVSQTNTHDAERRGVGGKLFNDQCGIKTSKGVEIPKELQTTEFLTAWRTWETHLREKRVSRSTKADESQLANCVEWGATKAIANISYSIAGGYQGLFAPRTNGTTTGHRAPDRTIHENLEIPVA